MMKRRNIPEKANKVLNLVLFALILILFRIWYLTVLHHEEGVEASKKPSRQSITLKAERASIRDRFNIPLALNQMQYNVSLSYTGIKEIPSVIFDDKRRKYYKRKEYISQLSKMLGELLEMDPGRIEDLIHAKVALQGNLPLTIKEDIDEALFYRLRMLQKDWPGLIAERVPRRIYPLGRVGCDVVGYMGAISQREFDKIILEIQELKEKLALEEANLATRTDARGRLLELQERAYTLIDRVGKSGVEASFDETLRGFRGRRVFAWDIKGHLLRELPQSRPSCPGKRLVLTISSKLQEYAEALLAESELRTCKGGVSPWIKGGAIIAMDPNTGDILALASYPRFDPSDFAKKQHVSRWLESETYLGELWDQKESLRRERYSFSTQTFKEETKLVTWESYLHMILPSDHPVRQKLAEYNTLHDAARLQRNILALKALFEGQNLDQVIDRLYTGGAEAVDPRSFLEVKEQLQPYLEDLSPYDRKLLIDLYSIAANASSLSPKLLKVIGKKSLAHYRQMEVEFVTFANSLQEKAKQLFHQNEFAAWRKAHQATLLKEMRAWEKHKKLYPRPYIDYIDKEERRLFAKFWKEKRCLLVKEHLEAGPLKEELASLPEDLVDEYLATFRSFSELTAPLIGKYRGVRNANSQQLQKDLAAAFYPKNGFGYGRSFAFRQATQVGSVFKIVSAYAGLVQPYEKHFYPDDHLVKREELNPLTIIDDLHRVSSKDGKLRWNVGYLIDGTPIPQHYKGGRIPRSQHSHIGKVDLAAAIETSSNPYFALLAGDVIEDPKSLLQAARLLSYGETTGIDLPGEIAGKLPDDICKDKSALYAFSIGQHAFIATPLQTAVMLSALANTGTILKPNIILLQAGKSMSSQGAELLYSDRFPYQEPLSRLGINFPLFTAPIGSGKNAVVENASNAKRAIFMPNPVREYLLDALSRVMHGEHGTGRESQIKPLIKRPVVLKNYIDITHSLVGKTSTAELIEQIDLSEHGVRLVNHTGFAAIAFEEGDQSFEHPELVVVVYLRFGDYGKEAVPIATEIVKKWREIEAIHLNLNEK